MSQEFSALETEHGMELFCDLFGAFTESVLKQAVGFKWAFRSWRFSLSKNPLKRLIARHHLPIQKMDEAFVVMRLRAVIDFKRALRK